MAGAGAPVTPRARDFPARARARTRSVLRRRLGWKPYRDEIVPPCALCGGSDRLLVGRRVAFDMRYQTVVCRQCGLVYLCPRPDEAAFEDFYARLYPALYGEVEQDDRPSPRGTAVARYIVEHTNPEQHRGLFDIGCGGGGLLRAIAHEPRLASLRLAGCDPGWPGAGHALLEEAGAEIEVFRARVEQLVDALSDFSIFVLYDVIEHLLAPGRFLADLHAAAVPQSLLFVATNALDNWVAIPPAGWERYYLRLAHTYTFTKRTLCALLSGHGWRVVATADAPKGDQWLLAERAEPDPDALMPSPGHAREVLSMIDAYRRRSAC
jgi:2-polyprenyl-3-methyl-5-hydroxy-6-metoxy-1,4-benzoquinol methylase